MYRSLEICYFRGFLLGLPGLNNFHHLWGESLLIRLSGVTCPARLVGQTTFNPNVLVPSLDSGCFKDIATVSIGIYGCATLFNACTF